MMNKYQILKNKIKKFPKAPGVYLFLNSNNKPLYIGRATILKNRIQSYFRKNTDLKSQEMVFKSSKLKYIQTDSILEAIFLEANLIKKYWPKYNIKDKDFRSFAYIIFTKTDFPRPIIIRQRELKKTGVNGNYFGPFQSYYIAKNVLKIIRKIFPFSTCKPGQGKPCFYAQIEQCMGVCTNSISKKDYLKIISNIKMLFSGQKSRLIRKLEKDNPFQAQLLKHVQDVALITNEEVKNPLFEKTHRIEGYDISHMSGKEVYGSMVVFENNVKNTDKYRIFKIKKEKNNDLENLAEVVRRRFKHKEWTYPDVIVVDGGKPQVGYLKKIIDSLESSIILIGISKYGGDKLVFAKSYKNEIKESINSNKKIFLNVREEAHRFANRFRKNKYLKRFKQ